MLVTYLLLLVSITFTVTNINLRSPKTYWVLLLPVPTAILIPIKHRQEQENQLEIALQAKKYKIKELSQPLVCKGCHNFDFSKVDDLSYACKLYPKGNKDEVCSEHQTFQQWSIAWDAKVYAEKQARLEAIERLKIVRPQVCESCWCYEGVDKNLEAKVCFYYPNGIEGNKCDKKHDGKLRLRNFFGH